MLAHHSYRRELPTESSGSGRTAMVAALAAAVIGAAGLIGRTWGRLVWLMAVVLSVGVAVYAVVQPQPGSEGLYGLAALALVTLVGRR